MSHTPAGRTPHGSLQDSWARLPPHETAARPRSHTMFTQALDLSHPRGDQRNSSA
ncbi:hypothetical protein E2C01_060512 [Portunus trituberculatus]|uniref:Uncharacterized protein n=1 Tax=Portunus trituberculatus TaxID=210409 RepID=A0A5B7H9N0_PORTR|nr:hypothetical protein [Portunus trituberculatus]